jgi:hypothetical protein
MCGGKMKKLDKFNAGMALGSLTAAVALLAGMSVASAQTKVDASDDSVSGQAAPGGGSFPGSFLVPGTNTSIKIGGFAKGVVIYDASASGGGSSQPVVAFGGIPLEGSAQHQLHGNVRIHAKQSNFGFDVRTPTAWGELDTFILTDFFGNQSANSFSGSNTENARLVLAYGSLGPVLVGQALTLFFDGQAIGESVDPTTSVGVNNGLTNRQPQVRYTWVGAGGLSVAADVEQPVWEVFAADLTTTQGQTATTINKYPDFLAKVQLDQGWGHVALAGVFREQKVVGIGLQRAIDKTGWGFNLTGHVNTFGKDTLRAGAIVGKALGHYLSQMGVVAGVQANSTSAAAGATFNAAAPWVYGVHIDYTHWWTNELRSTIMGGYEHLNMDKSLFPIGNAVAAAAANALDKTHIGGTINLVWSPVPQVDFGIEYDWGIRRTQRALPGTTGTDRGDLNRIEGMGVFKF